MNNMEYNLGILAGIIVGVVIVAVALWWNKKKNGSAAEFDERQKHVRGEVFQHAFFAVMAWNLLYWALTLAVDHPLMVDGLSGLVGLFIGVLVLGAESIWKDAFFTASSRPKSYVLLYAAVCLCEVPSAILNWKEMFQDGVLTYKVMPLVALVTFLVIFLTLILKLTRKEPDEE